MIVIECGFKTLLGKLALGKLIQPSISDLSTPGLPVNYLTTGKHLIMQQLFIFSTSAHKGLSP